MLSAPYSTCVVCLSFNLAEFAEDRWAQLEDIVITSGNVCTVPRKRVRWEDEHAVPITCYMTDAWAHGSVRYLIHKPYELHWNHLIPFALALALMYFFLLIAIPRRQSATEKGRHRVLPLSNQNNNHLISDFPADGAPLSGRISL